MTFGYQTTTWIYNVFASVSVVAPIDEIVRSAFRTQTKSFVGDELVCAETVVKLYHLNILRCHTRLGV